MKTAKSSKEKNDHLILNHYKKIAENYKESGHSSIKDQFIRDCEIDFFVKSIEDYLEKTQKQELRVLDAGCGNGFLLERLRSQFPKLDLYGVEFTPELISIAQDKGIENCEVSAGDLREGLPFDLEFDVIITERVIINILDYKDQKKALGHISKALKKGGMLLQSESYLEPFYELNRARREVKLSPFNVSAHNLYLNEYMVAYMRDHLELVEVEASIQKNFLSSHFYISRVFHPTVRPEGGKVRDSRMTRFFVEAVGPGIGNYSPILFRAFKKGT